MEISRVGIGKISVPELGTNSAIGWISRSGIGSFHVQNPHPHPRGIDCFLCSEVGWISIPRLARGRVCFLGSGLRIRVFFLWLALFIPHLMLDKRSTIELHSQLLKHNFDF